MLPIVVIWLLVVCLADGFVLPGVDIMLYVGGVDDDPGLSANCVWLPVCGSVDEPV